MKKPIRISIPTPCTQSWDQFTPVSGGRHCQSCDKVVMDFASMSDDEVFGFFSKNAATGCGRFRKDQLKTYYPIPAVIVKPGPRLFTAGLITLLLTLFSRSLWDVPVSPKEPVEIVQLVQTTGPFDQDCEVQEIDELNTDLVWSGEGLNLDSLVCTLHDTHYLGAFVSTTDDVPELPKITTWEPILRK